MTENDNVGTREASGEIPDGAVALRLVDGSKSHREGEAERAVFRDVEFAVREGEVFALLGPTGCGKSTLLRAVAGLDDLTGGRVEIPGGGKIGMVFQDARLFPWLTAAENVGLGLRYRANRGAGEPEDVEDIMRDFGLSDVAGSYPAELSGGQAQRANLARTLVTRPEVLLLDEPFSALDPRIRGDLQDWLLKVARERGLTVVFVTHDLDEAVYLGDRVGLMSGSPASVAHLWDVGQYRDRDRGAERSVREDIMSKYGAAS